MSSLLHLDRLSLAAPDGRFLFSDLTLSIGREAVGLVGRNGSGKSTLLRAIAGEVRPVAGSISLSGRLGVLRQASGTAQGNAFIEAARAAWPCQALDRLKSLWDGPVAYPIAVAVTAAGHGIALAEALPAYLHALTANWVSAGVRLIPLGQTQGLRVLASLEPAIIDIARRGSAATLDDLGSSAFRAALASARHETQYTRLFRS